MVSPEDGWSLAGRRADRGDGQQLRHPEVPEGQAMARAPSALNLLFDRRPPDGHRSLPVAKAGSGVRFRWSIGTIDTNGTGANPLRRRAHFLYAKGLLGFRYNHASLFYAQPRPTPSTANAYPQRSLPHRPP